MVHLGGSYVTHTLISLRRRADVHPANSEVIDSFLARQDPATGGFRCLEGPLMGMQFQTDFATLHGSYYEQALGLIEGGVDLLIIETCQDLLQVKAALLAGRDAMKELGADLPVAVSVTVGKRTCSNRLSPGGIIPAPICSKAVRVCRSMICVLKAFKLSRKNRLMERAMAVKAR